MALDKAKIVEELSNATVIEIAVHLGVIGFLAWWTFTLILPFAPVVLWSVVLTVALYPVFDWLAHKLQGRRRLAAALITLLGLLVESSLISAAIVPTSQMPSHLRSAGPAGAWLRTLEQALIPLQPAC